MIRNGFRRFQCSGSLHPVHLLVRTPNKKRRVQDTERQLALVQCLFHTKSPRLYLAIFGLQTDHPNRPGMVAVTWCESGISELLLALFLNPELASAICMLYHGCFYGWGQRCRPNRVPTITYLWIPIEQNIHLTQFMGAFSDHLFFMGSIHRTLFR